MPSLLAYKKRIRSVGNIAKMTKAMEMVSASKMRQSQLQALASRAYARKLEEILGRIAGIVDTSAHPLLAASPDAREVALVVISTDKGLTGSLNANLFKAVSHYCEEFEPKVFTIGRLAKEFVLKAGLPLEAEFGHVGDKIAYADTQPIASLLIKEFIDGRFSQVSVAYMDFVSTLVQKPKISQLLPLARPEVAEDPAHAEPKRLYTFEPDPQALMDWMFPYTVEISLFQSLLEARASEHSARMVAMRNASDNATELKSTLTLGYNRSRQANITSELADIVTASLTV